MNSKSLKSLVEATAALADTLQGLAQLIQAGIEEYPEGSQESSRVKDAVFGSGTLFNRVNRLQRSVGWYSTLDVMTSQSGRCF